jgi:hypothetical protein
MIILKSNCIKVKCIHVVLAEEEAMAFNLVVKLSVELGYVFLSLRL